MPSHFPDRPRNLLLIVLAAGSAALAGACTAGAPAPGPSASASASATFHPTAATPSIAVAALRKAWTTGDRAAAGDDAPADVLNVLFSVPPKGWGSPHCKEGICRLRKTGVPGSMTWMVEGGSSGYFVGEVDVPPIPLAVAHLPKPVWGLYLAAGGSGYSQLAAATAQLQALGMSGQTIGNLPVSCQSSVAERLQVPAGFYTIVVFFRRKSEAQTFESGLHFPPIGLLKVTVRC